MNNDDLEQVKIDAYKTTLRHFRDEIEDNHFQPKVPLDEVRAQLLGEPVAEEGELVEDAPKRRKKADEVAS